MRRVNHNKPIAAAVVGNALDWYDFTIYGYFASLIAAQFFPPSSNWTPILSVFAIFAVSFLVRPFGGIVVAMYADVVGRRRVMIWIIALMFTGTALIAFAPVYASAGMLSPVILLLARILQGLAAGGEFATATSFLVEHAPERRRGLYGGWQLSGQGIAIFLAGVLATLATHLLTPPELQDWGWRLPFFFGLLVGPIGVYLRVRATDTREFLCGRVSPGAVNVYQLRRVLRDHKRNLAVGFGLVIGGTAALYALFIFMPTYALQVLKLDPGASFMAPALAGVALAALCPVTGAISDRFGRKPVMVAGALASVAVLYPAFLWLQSSPSFLRLCTAELLFGILIAIYGGPFSTAMAELFPVPVRATALSIAYNLGVAAFGGFAPLIVAWLLAETGDSLAPAYYVAACMLLSLIACASLPKSDRSEGLLKT